LIKININKILKLNNNENDYWLVV